MGETSAPLWLEIKTEYIDDNLDKVIEYLIREGAKRKHDAFYLKTVDLLNKRVEELVEQLATKEIWAGDESGDKLANIAATKMLGAAILIDNRDEGVDNARYFYFLKCLAMLIPEACGDEIVGLAVKCLTYGVENTGFGWNDITLLQPEVLFHKLLKAARFREEPSPEIWMQNRGSVCIKDGRIRLLAGKKDKAWMTRTSESLQILDDAIAVLTLPGERIAQKDTDNPDVMEKFTSDFIREAEKTLPASESRLKTYSEGDVMPVRFTGRDFIGNLTVETVEGDHEKIEGQLPYKGVVFRQYYTNDIIGNYLKPGEIFEAEYMGGSRNTFSIQKTFLNALLDNNVNSGDEINAELKQINSKGLMTWWTEAGYPAYVEPKDNPGTYVEGDNAVLLITGHQSNGYVYATIAGESETAVDEDESKRYCIEGMLYDEDYTPTPAPAKMSFDVNVVKGLLRLLFEWQRTVSQTWERFRILCVCRILAAMTEEKDAKEYIELSCLYLKNLVAFAMGRSEDIKPIVPTGKFSDAEPLLLRGRITRLLQAYGVDADNDMLSEIIHDGDADPILLQLAKLIQSCNRIDDVYPAIKTVIKREILRFLSVQTEDNTDLEEATGPNLGVENNRQEFKVSFLMAPAKAYEQNQEKNIFRSLCAFLNTQEGGTLYLGVNDQGGVNGLEFDIERLEKKRINSSYHGLDGYIRYIIDRARNYFDLDVCIHFKIEPMYDGKVVAIHVEPYQNGVVEFCNVAYIRINNESVKMSPTLRRQIEAKRLTGAQERSKNVVALAEAIREGRQVTLYGYASANGTGGAERHVEPFAFVGNNAYVWTYDIDDGKVKIYRVSRIGNVRIGDAWKHESLHRKLPIDVFHFTGEKEIRVRLELDLLARNLLIEEYPDASADVTDEGDGKWVLDTTVHDIHGVGRFYCGLAEHIRILEGSELVEFARAYFAEGLKRLK